MQTQAFTGHMNDLTVTDITDAGAYVNAFEYGSLFVPRSQLPKGLKEGDSLKVFLFMDGRRVLATAKKPYVEQGQLGMLRVSSEDCGTIYMDMGIPKELVVPVSEQRELMEVGSRYLVYVAVDDYGRMFGTQRFNRYIKDTVKGLAHEYKTGEAVSVVPVSRTPLGYKVIVNDEVYGLIFRNEQKGELIYGRRVTGFVQHVRPDGKMDITLQEPGRSGIDHAAQEILQALQTAGGTLNFSDRSDPADIEAYLHMSKGKFKKAIGSLYKARLIELHDDCITLTEAGRKTGPEAEKEESEADRAL